MLISILFQVLHVLNLIIYTWSDSNCAGLLSTLTLHKHNEIVNMFFPFFLLIKLPVVEKAQGSYIA